VCIFNYLGANIEKSDRVLTATALKSTSKECFDMANSNIIRSWNGRTIRQRNDGYLSATDMCQACDKLFKDFEKTNTTQEYLKRLADKLGFSIRKSVSVDIDTKDNCPSQQGYLIEIIPSNIFGQSIDQGTWVHRKVALRLAQWLSPDFAIQVDEWVEDLLLNGKVELVPEKPKSTISAYEGLSMLRESLLNCVAPPLVEGIIINGIGRICPEIEPEIKAAHKLLAATTESEILLTPTSIGERLGISNRKVNSILINMGYQVKNTNAKKGEPAYLATPKGIPHAVKF
jgi:hypothetical protein